MPTTGTADERGCVVPSKPAEPDQPRSTRAPALAAAGAVALVLAAVGAYVLLDPGQDSVGTGASSGSSASCEYERTDEPAAKEVAVPSADDVVTTGTQQVTLRTNRGDVTIELDAAGAPCTVHSFRSLAEAGYFDGTSCHRLTTQGILVIQCGDPTGTGSGGPGYQFADENLDGATYPRGTVAMANAGPGTNGSQFFLVYGDTELPPAYTPFGRVTAGLDVLEKVAEAGVEGPAGQGDGPPKLSLELEEVG